MSRRIRVRIAFLSAVPTFLAVLVCCSLAVLGAMPGEVFVALPVAVVVHAAVTFVRLGPGRSLV
ncbi:hypothetical protein AB0F11_27145 [Streptomyces sp. NPDC032472]|uniref:hypothetical protein n=1 Tax=Streptomyces sp. NPDC032472 TaxID=3155018 RepID=UPI0033E65B66